MSFNEHQALVAARIEYLRAKRNYKIAMRAAECAIARKRFNLPAHQHEDGVPALLRRQA